MKVNNTNSEFKDVIALLRNALSIGKYIDMRSRFASEHQWADEGPHLKKQAYAAWYLAKITIGENRDALEAYLKDNKEQFGEEDVQNFIAAIRVIDKEIEDSFEQEILKEDEMPMVKTKWKDDEYLLDDEQELEQEEVFDDEDEEYVRQTETVSDDGADPDDEDDSYDPYEEDDEY